MLPNVRYWSKLLSSQHITFQQRNLRTLLNCVLCILLSKPTFVTYLISILIFEYLLNHLAVFFVNTISELTYISS